VLRRPPREYRFAVKRPYREGDWFAVPLGDGRFASGVVTRGTHKAIEGAFFSPAAEPLWRGRFSDKALVQLRWPLLGRRSPGAREGGAARESEHVAEPGEVERRLAALVAGEAYEPPRLAVCDLRPAGAHALGELGAGTRVQWRDPLAPRELECVEHRTRAGASVRLYGRAAAQAGELAAWPALARVELDAAFLPERLAPFPHVRELALEGVPHDLAAVLGAFASLETLRIRGRGASANAAAFAAARGLRVLDLHGVALHGTAALAKLEALRVLQLGDVAADDPEAPLRLPLESLRAARVAGVRSLEALRANASLRALALAGLTALDDASPIASLERLESLELRGLWQFGVGDLAFVERMPALRRLFVDIGGRRKNVEIYRKRSLALPLPPL
jgi:hypothetical protein